jgi:hypothetical protein
MRVILYGLVFLLLSYGCVQIYEFNNKNNTPSLVIEGQISDKSYTDCLNYPADGRYFSVKLRWTSPVTNTKDPPAKGATVYLSDQNGNRWNYSESLTNPGEYFLYDRDFRAQQGIQYKLIVSVSDGREYESDWEQTPAFDPGPMGNIDFSEVQSQQYIYRGNEKILTNIRGINVSILLPEDPVDNPIYYKWDFTPTWVYRATLSRPSDPKYRCWISNPYYLSDYMMHKDNTGNYKQDLFYLPIDFNDRIYDRLSVLIRQYYMSENYFNYWQEIQEQGFRKGLFDPPPFNLQTNLHSNDPSQNVYGYFGVVVEQAKRWNISRTDLSYPVENTWMQDCNPGLKVITEFDPCINCFNSSEFAKNSEPDWWEK